MSTYFLRMVAIQNVRFRRLNETLRDTPSKPGESSSLIILISGVVAPISGKHPTPSGPRLRGERRETPQGALQLAGDLLTWRGGLRPAAIGPASRASACGIGGRDRSGGLAVSSSPVLSGSKSDSPSASNKSEKDDRLG